MLYYILFTTALIVIIGYIYQYIQNDNIELFSNNVNDCSILDKTTIKNEMSPIDYDNEEYCNRISNFYIKTA